MRIRQIAWVLPMALPLLFLPGVTAQQAQPELGPQSSLDDERSQAQILAYWTPERMASAVPMTPPERLVEHMPQVGFERASLGTPGHVNGWNPASGAEYVEQRMSYPDMVPQILPQAFGTAPTNPLAGPYGPFQRWTMQGTYLPWPRSVHGKLFFSFGASNFVCSGSVIGRSTIATAGHCVSNGAGTFATNRVFCPSYTQAGGNPARGCWTVPSATTSNQWHNSGDPDYDYACGVTAVTGTVIANKMGNVTGWAGRAWNWSDVPTMTFGYPQGSPFTGTTIQQTASVEWYSRDFTAGGPASKVIGSDLTGGSSGGGWFLSWRHPTVEIVDTDGNNNTDPAGAQNGPYINGVNSHKACVGNCNTPPTATTGLFWQEMTSPTFRLDAGDNNDSEDVFAVCLANANNNASAPAIR